MVQVESPAMQTNNCINPRNNNTQDNINNPTKKDGVYDMDTGNTNNAIENNIMMDGVSATDTSTNYSNFMLDGVSGVPDNPLVKNKLFFFYAYEQFRRSFHGRKRGSPPNRQTSHGLYPFPNVPKDTYIVAFELQLFKK
jgi:hypothetical protein